MSLIKRLWSDEAGFIVSAELVLVATITVIGMVVGLAVVRDSTTNELADTAGAIDDVNQSYNIGGIQGHSAVVAGFGYADNVDYCDGDDDDAESADQCVDINSINTPPTAGEAVAIATGSDAAGN